MPRHDYECQAPECGKITEHFETTALKDCGPLTECPACGGAVKRLIGSFEFPDYCQDSKVSHGEHVLHLRNKLDIEKAHRNGTLKDYKRGRKTLSQYQPSFDQ